MTNISKWLEDKLSKLRKPVDDDEPSNPESDELDTTVPDLKTLDSDSSDTDKSDEFDPDDTVVLRKK